MQETTGKLQQPPLPSTPSPFALVSSKIPGILLCLVVAVAAYLLGSMWKIIGGAVIAIICGIVINNIFQLKSSLRPGIKFCSKYVLQFSIVVLGASFSLKEVFKTGRESLTVMLITLATALLAAWIIGKVMKVHPRLASLVGVGTGICGGSAIAAVAPIIQADDDEIAFSISTVFLFNVIAVLIFPPLGHILGLGNQGFGIWAGTAINDTSSVVAAGYTFSHLAGQYATITKLARTTMIIPISLAFAVAVSRKQQGAQYSVWRVMPWFVLFFLFASILNTAGAFGHALPPMFGECGRFLIIVALAGVGLGTNFRNFIKTGPRPIILGFLVWAVVALTSLGVQTLMHQW